MAPLMHWLLLLLAAAASIAATDAFALINPSVVTRPPASHRHIPIKCSDAAVPSPSTLRMSDSDDIDKLSSGDAKFYTPLDRPLLAAVDTREAWDKVLAQQETDEAFDATCVSVNRGGAVFLVEGLRAILPRSHLSGRLPDEDLIGQTLPLKFLEVNQDDNKLVVSNCRAVVEAQMEDLSRGDVIDGLVKALKPYGAFVEVGGMSGLLHISQISMDRIVDLERVLQPGQRIKCMIIDHDKVNGRIALSTKTLEPEPGDMIKDPERVYEMAEETARVYLELREKHEAELKKREVSAKQHFYDVL